MRLSKWGGLMTNASPYAIPPGAAVKQVNLVTTTVGQLTTRGGMQPVTFSDGESPENVVDLYCYSRGSKPDLVFVLDDTGELSVLAGPAADSPLSVPAPYTPTASAGGVVVSYTYAYADGGAAPLHSGSSLSPGAATPPVPDEPAPLPQLTGGIVGGSASTSGYEEYLDANQNCVGGVDDVQGGTASTNVFPPSIDKSEICDL